jgi:hypothetical protein
MSKMGSHYPFGYLIHKNKETPWFICVQVVCHISLERSWRGIHLCCIFHLNQRSTQKVIGLQSYTSPDFKNFEVGSPGTKWYLGVGPMAKDKEYYKGGGGGFPQVQAMLSFVNTCLPVARPCIKKASNYALTNLLFGLCTSIWIIDPLCHSS